LFAKTNGGQYYNKFDVGPSGPIEQAYSKDTMASTVSRDIFRSKCHRDFADIEKKAAIQFLPCDICV